jgi:hypothetical protein
MLKSSLPATVPFVEDDLPGAGERLDLPSGALSRAGGQ